jgi:hypothetical protein
MVCVHPCPCPLPPSLAAPATFVQTFIYGVRPPLPLPPASHPAWLPLPPMSKPLFMVCVRPCPCPLPPASQPGCPCPLRPNLYSWCASAPAPAPCLPACPVCPCALPPSLAALAPFVHLCFASAPALCLPTWLLLPPSSKPRFMVVRPTPALASCFFITNRYLSCASALPPASQPGCPCPHRPILETRWATAPAPAHCLRPWLPPAPFGQT